MSKKHMENLILGLIIKNENFRSEYAFPYFMSRTNVPQRFTEYINSLEKKELLIVQISNGLKLFSPTTKGIEYLKKIDFIEVINNSEEFFVDKEFYKKLSNYF
jgi:predicted transcriptional regulator